MGSPVINQVWLAQKRRAMQYLRPSLNLDVIQQRPGDAQPFDFAPAPFPAYPAPGAAASIVLTWTVPPGYFAVVKWLAVIHVGGGYVDGSGDIIWRVLINGAAVRGLNNLQSQIGVWALPNELQFYAPENAIVSVTVEVPLLATNPPVAGMTTGARMRGYFYPVAVLGAK